MNGDGTVIDSTQSFVLVVEDGISAGSLSNDYIDSIEAVIALLEAQKRKYEQAEAARVAAESGRASAESGRVAETARADAERLRASSEGERNAAESSRASEEAKRAQAESVRASAESARASAESKRAEACRSREPRLSPNAHRPSRRASKPGDEDVVRVVASKRRAGSLRGGDRCGCCRSRSGRLLRRGAIPPRNYVLPKRRSGRRRSLAGRRLNQRERAGRIEARGGGGLPRVCRVSPRVG